MCLAVPAKIISTDNIHAWVDIMGVRQKINVMLIDSPKPDEHVLVHAGFAIEKMNLESYSFINDILYELMEDMNDE